jgi:hypothetical protein
MKDMSEHTVRVMRIFDGNPMEFMARQKEVLGALAADFRRVCFDNLDELLALHTGEDDTPSGLRTAIRQRLDSPFDVNRAFFIEALDAGRDVFSWTFEGCAELDEEDDEEEVRSARRVEFVFVDVMPAGWLTVAEVCEMKDCEPSAVTRAIADPEAGLTAVMTTKPRRRYIRPDMAYLRWNPGRKRISLLRRRLELLSELLPMRGLSLHDLMLRVKVLERRRYGTAHAYEGSLQDFFQVCLEECPRSLMEWRNRIDAIIEEAGHESDPPLRVAA